MTHYVLPSAGLSNKWPEAGKGQTKFGLLQQNLFYHTTTEKLIGDLDMQYLGDKGVPGENDQDRTPQVILGMDARDHRENVEKPAQICNF